MQTEGLWSTPAYWNGNVYMWGSGDVPKLFQLNSGVMNTTPVEQVNDLVGISGRLLFDVLQWHTGWHCLGGADRPVHHPWAAVLYAWDANDLTNTAL